tara:strand:- start:11084 stop:11911 length:828 start_codon:yes stop_codon:yes gene_type:complete
MNLIMKDKIAFLFLTVGDLNQELMWKDFFNEGGDRCTIYAHTKEVDKLEDSILKDKQIDDKIETKWGHISLVQATNLLFKHALKDKNNKYFMLVSETCMPLYSFDFIYDIVTKHKKSWVNETGRKLKFKENAIKKLTNPESIGILKPRDMKFCSQWILLNRKHAEIVSKYDYTDTVFKNQLGVADECYHINVLKHHDPNFFKNSFTSEEITFKKFLGLRHPHPHEWSIKKGVKTLRMLSSFKSSMFFRKVESANKLDYKDIKECEFNNYKIKYYG